MATTRSLMEELRTRRARAARHENERVRAQRDVEPRRCGSAAPAAPSEMIPDDMKLQR